MLVLRISIHAPREGCDGVLRDGIEVIEIISIHAPREGCDEVSTIVINGGQLFQSTHPVRGATKSPPS